MRISVVTVCFNSGATIGDTLASVAAQDWPDYEHIIVDGASADDTMAVVGAHAHARLKAISESDEGLYHAMNKGLGLATGDYVIFLNSDDFFARPDVLSLVVARLGETGADCLFADTEFVKRDGVTPANRIYSARRFRKWWIRIGIMPPHPSMFVRRHLLLGLGGFDTSFRISADFDLIARALLKEGGSWAVMPVVITIFRIGGLSTSGLATNLELGREMARSLRRLGQPLADLAVQLRFPLKATQLRLFGRRAGPWRGSLFRPEA